MLLYAIGEDVYHFQPGGSKKGKGGSQDKDSSKQQSPPQDHEKKRQYPEKIPLHPGSSHRIGQQNKSLQQPAHTSEIHLACNHLKYRIPGANQNTVELTVAQHRGKTVKAAKEKLRQIELKQHCTVALQYLTVSKAFHRMKALKHKIDA